MTSPARPAPTGVAPARAVAADPGSGLDEALARARAGLVSQQDSDGSWCFELEADCTIPAEYILMMHFLDEVDPALERKLAAFVRDRQAEHGGWPLYHLGALNISASVKSYWALKIAGDDPDEPHMARAREAILEHGGAARCNVFTRITMALFGQVPWRAVPLVPAEIALLPRWFPFHLLKVSYWSRTVMVPLSILCTLRAKARNPRGVHIHEIFTVPPEEERDYFPVRSAMNRAFLAAERTLTRLEPLVPAFLRRRGIRASERWLVERLNGVDGLGCIFPAMVNAAEALAALGYPPDHPLRAGAREALRRLVVEHDDRAYCQPCFSSVWDTAIACLALEETRAAVADEALERVLERAAGWLEQRQIRDGPADWRQYRPELEPGGWPFQYRNSYYPDLDDTAMVAWALHRRDPQRHAEPVRRAANWVRGMQSRGGGFASFDADNTHFYLNEIPFADHGALLDPPSADVTARCVGLLALLRRAEDAPSLRAALECLDREQESDGSWFGRWGTNYIYGTWSVLAALELVGEPQGTPRVRRAASWLKGVQRPDGGWGESNDTYLPPEEARPCEESTPFQTAWALLGLLAAGEGDSPEVRRGVEFLLRTQRGDGLWFSDFFTAPGFPRVFYLRYHGYQAYFPLWALARYRRFLAQGPR